ncbi:sulfite exporter TauE/SafE family protein [Nisaea sp.]|uniref:sulfite exporter TauE/SafE family protein n=1 Tax=Nisaea sp. TaxID=2024842 RepID=UPI0032EDA27F
MGTGLTLIICAVMVSTTFLSGLFGMAGGLVLVGVLFALLPVQDALTLHGITQLASNLWRAAMWWRFIRPRTAIGYMIGCLIVLGAWTLWQYIPSKAVALLLLGVLPFLSRLLPSRIRGNPETVLGGLAYGLLCMVLMLVTGVAGPVLDQFFLNGKLDRREIIATKGVCQVAGHALKVLYFGFLLDSSASIDPTLAILAVGSALLGTWLAKPVLQAMSDTTYRRWAGHIVTVVSLYYVGYGGWLIADVYLP